MVNFFLSLLDSVALFSSCLYFNYLLLLHNKWNFFVQADRVIKVLLSLLFRYSWKKDGRPFDWTVYNDRITQQAGRGTLVIKSPRDEDVGKFPCRCIASTEHLLHLQHTIRWWRKKEAQALVYCKNYPSSTYSLLYFSSPTKLSNALFSFLKVVTIMITAKWKVKFTPFSVCWLYYCSSYTH